LKGSKKRKEANTRIEGRKKIGLPVEKEEEDGTIHFKPAHRTRTGKNTFIFKSKGKTGVEGNSTAQRGKVMKKITGGKGCVFKRDEDLFNSAERTTGQGV